MTLTPTERAVLINAATADAEDAMRRVFDYMEARQSHIRAAELSILNGAPSRSWLDKADKAAELAETDIETFSYYLNKIINLRLAA